MKRAAARGAVTVKRRDGQLYAVLPPRVAALLKGNPTVDLTVESGEIVAQLRERFGITIAGGQGELRDKIFRIGHIGYIDVFDVSAALAGLEVALSDAGVDIERGVAASRVLETYAQRAPV